MKTVINLLFLFLFISNAFSQTGKIELLENELNQSSGLSKIAKAISISEQCLSEGKYEKAEEFAEKAFLEAKKQGEREFQANALNRKGKALEKQEKKNFFGKDKATPAFKNCLEILTEIKSHNYALMTDNLEGLKRIYTKNNRTKEIAEVDARIAQIKGEIPVRNIPVAADNSANLSAKKQLQSEVNNLQMQNQQFRNSPEVVNTLY